LATKLLIAPVSTVVKPTRTGLTRVTRSSAGSEIASATAAPRQAMPTRLQEAECLLRSIPTTATATVVAESTQQARGAGFHELFHLPTGYAWCEKISKRHVGSI
jgi:hypothetical protein